MEHTEQKKDLIVFGSTGDLSLHYLMPALFAMHTHNRLPKNLRIVAFGRKDLHINEYLDILGKTEWARKVTGAELRDFGRRISYVQGNFEDVTGMSRVVEYLERTEDCGQQLYYLAVAPEFFLRAATLIKEAGLLERCRNHKSHARVVFEKPFGYDLKSAKVLDEKLKKILTEDQIYRIDHYLGKEVVQNLLVARFGNTVLESLWSSKFIDHVEISILEHEGLGARGAYYDSSGALRDLVQNHCLQLLALVAMETPKSFSAKDIRAAKAAVLQKLARETEKTIDKNVIKGQYIDGPDGAAYKYELGKPSTTETFVALKVKVRSQRWKGVPFFIKTGKRLGKKVAEVSVHFKLPQNNIFKEQSPAHNKLVFQIQPEESLTLHTVNKLPGFSFELVPSKLELLYSGFFEKGSLPAYERLLLDFIEGDQKLFISTKEIESSWQYIDSVIKNWHGVPLDRYPAGSTGPKKAENLTEWFTK